MQLYLKETSEHVFSCGYSKFYEQLFLCNASGDCICQFDKVTVLICSDLLFLIKNITWDGFYYKGL